VKVLGPNDKKISGLAVASALAGGDDVPVVQGGATKQATMTQIAAFVGRSVWNTNLANLGPGFAADTYLSGSDCAVPADSAFKAKTFYTCKFSISKTNAGTAAPVITVRIGTNGSLSDAARLTLTFPAQTAVVDEGVFDVNVIFKSVGIGTTAVIGGWASLIHDLGSGGSSAGTGLSVQSAPTVIANSSGFDSTPANSKIGLSFNGGTSMSATIVALWSQLANLA